MPMRNLIKFYDNQKYDIKSVSITATNARNNSVSLCFIHEDIKQTIGFKASEKTTTSTKANDTIANITIRSITNIITNTFGDDSKTRS